MLTAWSLEAVLAEFRLAFRRWLREPLFVAGVVVTLGLGLGATTLMAGILDALLLQPPPHLTQPNRVVRLFFVKDHPVLGRAVSSKSNYPTLLYLNKSSVFADMAGYSVQEKEIGRSDEAVRGTVAFVSARYFSVLGASPALGRFFSLNEESGVEERLAVLSDGFWRRQFGGDQTILGKELWLGGTRYTVVGVAPHSFTGPESQPIDLWVPLSTRPTNSVADWKKDGASMWLSLVARLRSGDTRPAASEMATRAMRRRLAELHARDTVVSLLAASTIIGEGPDRPPEVNVALWLGAVALLVMLLAIANVMLLLMARSLRRQGDITVRLALGARAVDLARLIVTEAVLLAALSSFAAFVTVWTSRPLVEKLLLPTMAWPDQAVDVRTGAIVAGIALMLALFMGYAPLRQARRAGTSNVLHHVGHRASGRSLANKGLLAFQSAVCTVLVFGAMLFALSLRRVEALDLGVDVDHTIMLSYAVNEHTSDVDMEQVYEQLLRGASRIQGIDHYALAEANPYKFGRAIGPYTDDKTFLELWDGREVPYVVAVGRGFFSAVNAKSLRGRDFGDYDRLGTELVTIINAPLAKVLWPGEDALGKRLRLDDGHYATVVGVLSGTWKFSVLDRDKMAMYVPLAQDTSVRPRVAFIHASGDLDEVRRALLRLAARISPSAPPPSIRVVREEADPEFRPWRLGATMFTAFGLLAMGIATVGLYSLVAYTTTMRRHEIGVRVALGAQAPQVLALIAKGNLVAVVAGVFVGAATAGFASRWVGGLLYQTSPRDPTLLAGTMLLLVIISLLASVVPVVRELKRSPISILKTD